MRACVFYWGKVANGGRVDCGNQIDVIVTSFHFAQPLLYKSWDHGTYMKRKRWCISPSSMNFIQLLKFRGFHGSMIISYLTIMLNEQCSFSLHCSVKIFFRRRHKTHTMKMDQVKIYSLNFLTIAETKYLSKTITEVAFQNRWANPFRWEVVYHPLNMPGMTSKWLSMAPQQRILYFGVTWLVNCKKQGLHVL